MGTNWNVIPRHMDLFIDGVIMTLKLSFWALIISIALGIILGLCRVSKKKYLNIPATVYIEFMRGIPLLVLLIWIYFVLNPYLGLSAFWAATFGLSVFSAAFVAEIVRAGIQSVPRGQMEAARSSGMTHIQAMKKIILPQAFRKVLPPLASQFIILIKDSSLVSVISVVDLTMVGRNVSATSFRTLEVWTFIALLYLVMTVSLSQIIRYIEKKYQVNE